MSDRRSSVRAMKLLRMCASSLDLSARHRVNEETFSYDSLALYSSEIVENPDTLLFLPKSCAFRFIVTEKKLGIPIKRVLFAEPSRSHFDSQALHGGLCPPFATISPTSGCQLSQNTTAWRIIHTPKSHYVSIASSLRSSTFWIH